MIGLLRLLHNEVTKATRRKLPYFGGVAVLLISLLVYVVIDRVAHSDVTNAWGYVTLSMQMVFTDIGLIFVIIFACLLMSEETRSGTIRALLAAPQKRWQVFMAKTLAGWFYMIVLSLVTLAFSAVLSLTQYEFGPVVDDFGPIYTQAEVLRNFVKALVLSWIPLAAMVNYGVLISTVVRSPGAAVGVGIGTVYMIDFTKHLVGIDPYIFTRYITYPWQVMHQVAQGVDYQWQPELTRMLMLCGINALVLFAVGLVVFTRQDLND